MHICVPDFRKIHLHFREILKSHTALLHLKVHVAIKVLKNKLYINYIVHSSTDAHLLKL